MRKDNPHQSPFSEPAIAAPAASPASRTRQVVLRKRNLLLFPAVMNSQQEAFRRFAQQLQRASQGSGGFPGGSPRGLLAGGGLVVVLIAGGLALSASLFNGKHHLYPVSWMGG